MKPFKTLLFVMFMGLAVMTWANWSPATASSNVDDRAVEETLGQAEALMEEEAVMEEEGAMEENAEEEWNDQEGSESETQEEAPYNN